GRIVSFEPPLAGKGDIGWNPVSDDFVSGHADFYDERETCRLAAVVCCFVCLLHGVMDGDSAGSSYGWYTWDFIGMAAKKHSALVVFCPLLLAESALYGYVPCNLIGGLV
ncbi:MAG: hypothetical protein HFH48_01815, partial [Lachnospiraceae bacterium]|nr:hypothetical protein [Lachnospiraceae bacterium]